MSKSDNKHAINLYNSIEKHIGQEAADDFIETLPLSGSAAPAKKSIWAKSVCDYLDERFTEDEIRKIRMDCSCNPGGKAEKIKNLYESSTDAKDFCERFNNEYAPGNALSCDNEALYFSYPTCYCSCVKRGDDTLTNAWCVCTLGYTEKLFLHAMSRVVKVELIESVKMGGIQCLMKIS